MSSVKDIGTSSDLRSTRSPGGTTKQEVAKNIEKVTKDDEWVKTNLWYLYPVCASSEERKQRAGILATSRGAGMTADDEKNFIEDFEAL